MNKEPYMGRAEMLTWLKIGVLAGEADNAAKTTKDKAWHRKLACVATYCQNIIEERLKFLDPKQIEVLKRRRKTTEIKLYTVDQKRARANEPNITIETEDLYDILDLALKSCFCCGQGCFVKDCKWREIFHRLNVEPLRFHPKEGECEFRLDNDQFFITPEEYKIEMTKAAKELNTDPKDVHTTTMV